MSESHTADVEKIQASYEGLEAIYLERGALRVRVHNVRIDTRKCFIEAEVEEVSTPGLGVGIFCKNEGRPRRWTIGGDLTACTDLVWAMGYGGWELHFARPAVEAVVALAAQWPMDLDCWGRYDKIQNCLAEYRVYFPHCKPLLLR